MYWDINSKSLKSFGKKVEEELKRFTILDTNTSAEKVPNISMAKGINQSISKLLKALMHTRPQYQFDKLIKKSFADSLFFTQEYIRLIFFENYNSDYGTEKFLDFVFLDSDEWNSGKAMKYLESILRNPGFSKLTQRQEAMYDVTMGLLDPSYENITQRIDKEVTKIKKFVRLFNVEKGFISEEYSKVLDEIDERRDIKKHMRRFEHILGSSHDKMNEILKNPVLKGKESLLRKMYGMPEELKQLNIFWEWVFDESSSFDGNTRTIELNAPRFFYYLDPKTKKVRFYGGDLYKTALHENLHHLHKFLSKEMPIGIKSSPNLNISGRVYEEGMCLYVENTFGVKFIEEHNKLLNFSKDDSKRLKNELTLYLFKKVIPLMYCIYKRINDIEQRSELDEVQMMAKTSGDNIFLDSNYLDNYSLSEIFYYSTYLFGHPQAKETFEQLKYRLNKLFGNYNKGTRWMKENESEIIQGALTGDWSWTTQRAFFLDFYIPELIKLREGKRVAARYERMFSNDLEKKLDIVVE